MDEVEICQAEIRRLRSVVRELETKESEQEYIFTLGFSLLQNFLSNKPCEPDAAYEFCRIVYGIFKTSEYYNTPMKKTDISEYDRLKTHIESLSYDELDELYWSEWSDLSIGQQYKFKKERCLYESSRNYYEW